MPSIPLVDGRVNGPVPVGALVTDIASCVERPQSISIVKGKLVGSPVIAATTGLPEAPSGEVKVVGGAIEL